MLCTKHSSKETSNGTEVQCTTFFSYAGAAPFAPLKAKQPEDVENWIAVSATAGARPVKAKRILLLVEKRVFHHTSILQENEYGQVYNFVQPALAFRITTNGLAFLQ